MSSPNKDLGGKQSLQRAKPSGARGPEAQTGTGGAAVQQARGAQELKSRKRGGHPDFTGYIKEIRFCSKSDGKL